MNWQAYRDIAEFFSHHIETLDGQRVYGHIDWAKREPSFGWRMSDGWFSLAGMGDKGLPNGIPVDEWGIRVEGCHVVGASVKRGGAINGPAAVYALDTFIDLLQFGPENIRELDMFQALEVQASGQVAQMLHFYTALAPIFSLPNSPLMDSEGNAKWRIVPSPVGKYWQIGMKSGYQDAGSWTILKSAPLERQKAVWLYAQFLVSKTVSLKKTLVGLTPIRASDIASQTFSDHSEELGGFVEFYQSNARHFWTPTGTNVPDYAGLSGYWWKHLSMAVEGAISSQTALDNLAFSFDAHFDELEQKEELLCSPILNQMNSEQYWLGQPGAPKPVNVLTPKGQTLPYEEAIQYWNAME